ncbi:hypothetical protein D3C80_1646740 [compost metagenome]
MRAASANGEVERASTSGGIRPCTAVIDRMYTAAAARVPNSVARGMVRFGSRTSSAGTVADSRPMNDQRVSAAVVAMAWA